MFDYLKLFNIKYAELTKAGDDENKINPDDIVGDEMSTTRILSTKEKSDKEKMKEFLKAPIFTATTINLKDFKVSFEGEGLDPIKDKDKSSINKTAYSNFQKKL